MQRLDSGSESVVGTDSQDVRHIVAAGTVDAAGRMFAAVGGSHVEGVGRLVDVAGRLDETVSKPDDAVRMVGEVDCSPEATARILEEHIRGKGSGHRREAVLAAAIVAVDKLGWEHLVPRILEGVGTS